MSRPQEDQSARSIVDQIFHDHSEDAKKYYESRLRTRYAEPNVRSHLPSQYYTEKRKGPDEKNGGIIFSSSESALTYYKNLLLLDGLFKRPSDVFKALGSDGKIESRKKENHNLRNMVRVRRYELLMRIDPIEAVLQQSSGWESAPDNFDPYRDSINNLVVAPPSAEPKAQASDSWKVKLAEEIIEIEHSDEWQNGEPNKVAEKAQIYIKMGLYGIAHQQVNTSLENYPENPALHFVKAQLLLSESAQLQWKAYSHQTLHQESAPMSGEEEHHAEQAFDNAQAALNKEEAALAQLMACYRYWDVKKLPNWAYVHHHTVHYQTLLRIIKLADRCIQQIYNSCNWLKDESTTVIEEKDSALSRDIIHFFTKGAISPDHVDQLYYPKDFATLLRFWSVMQRIKPLAYRNSVKQWRKSVEESYVAKPNSLGNWEKFKLGDAGSIRVAATWSNPWPKLINSEYSTPTFVEAMTEVKVPAKFFTEADQLLAEQQTDHRLWQRIQYAWRTLSNVQEAQHHTKEEEAQKVTLAEAVLKACKQARKACKQTPPSKTEFSKYWNLRWLYAEARCHFEIAICAWPDSATALASLNEVEKLRSKNPDIESLEHSHLTLHQCDEYEDYENPMDLLGHRENIFASTETEEPSQSWGAFSSYSDAIFMLDNSLSFNTQSYHHAFAEACSEYEGSLYEKAQQLFQHKGSSTS